MTTFTDLTWHAALSGRWIARIGGLLMVLFLAAFIIGEGPPNPLAMTARERLYGLGMLALFGGLAVAWVRPLWGAAVSLAGWAMLWALAGRPPFDLPLTLPAGFALVHLLCWLRLRGPAPAAISRPAWVTAIVLGPLPVFVILCANEMFGNPPLMASMKRPSAELAGNWSGTLTTNDGRPLAEEIRAQLTISPDGTTSGAIGSSSFNGRIDPNRSWFGRLMHWRSDYRLKPEPTAGARQVSLLLNSQDTALSGHVTLTSVDSPKSYRLVLRRN